MKEPKQFSFSKKNPRGSYKPKDPAEDNDLETSPEIKKKSRASWSLKKSVSYPPVNLGNSLLMHCLD